MERYIHRDFTSKLQKEWKEKEFNYKQVKEWINIGLKVNDSGYAQWLRDIKKADADWVLNYDNNKLRKEYKEFLSEKISAQRWLDKNYLKEERVSIKELDISEKDLRGELDLADFINLI